jgi:RNA polymerase sigma-70 factor (ECF subfamily)
VSIPAGYHRFVSASFTNARPLTTRVDLRFSGEIGRTAATRDSGLVPHGVDLTLADTESAWITQIRSGDVDAFEAVFRAFYAPLQAFARGYLKDAAISDELVQDVLCWIWEHRATWVVHTSLKHYLYGAVRNRALNHSRRQRIVERWERQAAVDALARPEGLCAEPTDTRVAEGDFTRALDRAIERLPPRCREAYTLRWRYYLSHKEVAARMGTSTKTVEVQIAKALKALRQELADFF